MFDGHLSTAGKCLQRSAHRTDMALKNDVPPFFWYQKWRKIKPCSLRAPRSCALAAQDSQVRTRPKDPGPSETAAEKVDTDIVGINLGGIMWNQCTYHLVMTNIAMENQHAINR